MKYRCDYQETHDIDWFFLYQGKVYHAASNGGMLPEVIDSRKNRILQEKLEDFVGVYEVENTEEALNRFNQGEDLSSFAHYAAKGMISMDRKEMKDDKNTIQYQIVAFPKNGESFGNQELIIIMPVLNGNEIKIL